MHITHNNILSEQMNKKEPINYWDICPIKFHITPPAKAQYVSNGVGYKKAA